MKHRDELASFAVTSGLMGRRPHPRPVPDDRFEKPECNQRQNNETCERG